MNSSVNFMNQGSITSWVLLANSAINYPSALIPCINALSIVLLSGVSNLSFSLLKRSIKSFRVSSFPWRRVNKQVMLFFLFRVARNCARNSYPSSLKVPTDFGISPVIQSFATPLKVSGKALHAIASGVPCRIMCSLKASR